MLKRSSLLAVPLFLLAATSAQAATGDPIRYHAMVGYSGVAGDAKDFVQDGWSFGFGVLYTPPKGFLSFRGDLGYEWWDVRTGNIPTGEVRIDDGDASVFSFRAGVQAGTKNETGFNFYGGVGIGGYYARAELTQTALVTGIWCDWWGWCYPITSVGDAIVADEGTTKFGYYGMVGGSYQVGSGDLFLEASYHWVQTKQTLEYFPIVLGYRW